MNNKNNLHHKRGFSIIEIVISMTIIAMLIPAVAAVLLTILRQQLVVYQLSVMKREGDSIAKIIKDEIQRDSLELHSAVPPANLICHPRNTASSPIGATVQLLRRNNSYFSFQRTATNILQRVSVTNAVTTNDNLHSTFIELESFTLSCRMANQYGSPIIFVSYTVAPRVDSADAQLRKRLSYQFQIKASTF